MMTIHFEFDWVDADPSPDMAMNQTMAQLSIQVAGETVTSVHDHTRDTYRDHVVVPLLSMAQWLVSNWCHIWHEIPDRYRQKYGFEQRHTLAFAGDGFIFPKLTMTPSVDGKQKLQWTCWQPDHAQIEFITSGKEYVDSNQLQAKLKHVIEAVLDRMNSFGHQHGAIVSDLKESWQAVETLDLEEREFCRAAALLGMDPFHLHQDTAKTIINFWDHTESSIREDIWASLEEANFREAFSWLDHTWKTLERNYAGSENEWAAIRNGLPTMRMVKPWKQGYALARCLRHELGCGDGWFNFTSSRQPALSYWKTDMPSNRVEGFVLADTPICAIVRKEGVAERFLLARALGDYIGRSETRPGILTTMDTARQAQSRAFAAELLAPSNSLRPRLADHKGTDEEVINDLSQEFKVSDLVIKHQIKNHNLTRSSVS